VVNPITGEAKQVQEVFIIGDPCFEKATVDPNVQAEMARLRQHRQVELSYTPLMHMPSRFSAAIHNATSAHKYMPHVAADYDLQVADVLLPRRRSRGL
jgi:hypothetical protein